MASLARGLTAGGRALETRLAEPVLLATLFLAANHRSLISHNLFPSTEFPWGEAWLEVALWLVVVLLAERTMRAARKIPDLRELLRRQWALSGFVLFSLLSITWSEAREVTAHRALVLACATFAALHLGIRYSRHELQRILFWVVTALVAGSLWMVAFRPALGTDTNPIYKGAWRGLFWHKNHLGALLPLFVLVSLVHSGTCWRAGRRLEAGLAGAVALVSLLMLGPTGSAAGILTTAALLFALALSLLWLRWADRLRTRHYLPLSLAAAGALVAVAANLDRIFALVGRDPSLTGRLPLWSILVGEVAPAHPWLGVGFGTIWADPLFRFRMKEAVGWPFPVMLGDNGFLDLLLNLGAVGLFGFLLLYGTAWPRATTVALRERTLDALFAPLFLLYTLLANLTFSMFLELETMVWVVFVAVLVQCDAHSERHDVRDGV